MGEAGDRYATTLETILQKAFGNEMNGPWTAWALHALTQNEILCLEQAGVKLNPSVKKPHG